MDLQLLPEATGDLDRTGVARLFGYPVNTYVHPGGALLPLPGG